MEDNGEWKVPSSLPDAAVEMDRVLLHELENWIRAGLIVVGRDSASYFALIESRYPIAVNRIDWGRVANPLFHPGMPLEEREHKWDERRAALESTKAVLLAWFSENSVGQQDRVIVLGDVSNVALHMSVSTLLDCCHLIFLSPQHVYVIPSDAAWCLNYGMKDQLWFGRAADSLATGWISEEKPE